MEGQSRLPKEVSDEQVGWSKERKDCESSMHKGPEVAWRWNFFFKISKTSSAEAKRN